MPAINIAVEKPNRLVGIHLWPAYMDAFVKAFTRSRANAGFARVSAA